MKAVCGFILAAVVAGAGAQDARNKPYTVSPDFKEVSNYKQFTSAISLTPAHKTMLQKNLFVCAPRGNWQLYDVYGSNKYEKLPSLVTTDNVLQLYHVFFDSTLRSIETNSLSPILKRLTARMLSESVVTMNETRDPVLRQAAVKNVAYFAVAARLLDPKSAIPAPAQAMATRELALISKAEGFTESAIFPYKVDYSQFIVRGHYTRTELLKRFFRTMMWYELVPFAAGEPGHPRMDEIRQALLITHTLYRARQHDDWMRIYEPTALYVGLADDLTPQEWKELADKVFGPNAPISAYSDSAKVRVFVDGVQKLRLAGIRSSKLGTGLSPEERQFRFMGQRYIPDSEVLQRLATKYWPRMPIGLDVMTVLGSPRAKALLKAQQEYKPEHDKLIAEFRALPEAAWHWNLYWGWLYAMKALLDPPPVGYPSFMLNPAWQDKSLYSALASWAELRHDTILYAKQSAAEGEEDREPEPYVRGYVEPNVPFYDRVLALTRQSREELTKRKLITSQVTEKFTEFENLLGFLRAVSIKELRNESLTRKEHDRIRDIEGDLSGLTITLLRVGTNYEELTDDDLDMALVADVYTHGGDALEEAVGHSNDIIAVVPIDGKLYLARGSMFSYYEFTVPISERMTDEQWKKKLRDGGTPEGPVWMKSFYVPSKAKLKAED